MSVGRRIEVRGTVQGVGFRPWVARLARRTGLGGRVRNDAAGVTIDAWGEATALESFTARLRADGPPGAEVRSLTWRAIAGEEPAGFEIAPSSEATERRLAIPPDLATCPECLAEVADPADRRHDYPFTNCTHCGPRFTIALDVPYDRPATTMAGFGMCARCRSEYEDAGDRRYHAQPIACPACGPRLRLTASDGTAVESDALGVAADALRAGRIVAVKGLGGFHLACDATSRAAVERLRARKRRDRKPFAVMVRTLAEAESLASLSAVERALLAGPAAPIVLAARRADARLAAAVAPESPLVGLVLAYSPLHHLLLARVGRPLVMTSGNLAGEPIAHRDDEAADRLGPIADLILGHDRPIAGPCEDSVVRVIAGAPTVLRRARGFVPRPVTLARPVARPTLGCGGDLKNAFCLAAGDLAYLGPHVGDLEDPASVDALADALDRVERILRVRAEVVAHDLHPSYLSTAFARSRAGTVAVGVQHHHAHVASAIAEHALAGRVLGVAWDGTGWGPDGTAWGGELLLADAGSYERVATTRPLVLAGGERAIRQPWRLALAVLDDAFDGAPPLDSLALFRRVSPEDVTAVRGLVASGVASPLAHGVGRWFDAFGALGLAMPESRFEGEVAMAWGNAVDRREGGAYEMPIDHTTSLPEIDLRPAVRAAVADLVGSAAPGVVSARFHGGLVRAAAAVVREAADRHGRLPVVLTGGCFQNPCLAEGVGRALGADLPVYRHREVPPGDGGLGLGQVLVGDARTRPCA